MTTPSVVAIADARQRYDADITSQWKQPIGFGSVPGVETGAGEHGPRSSIGANVPFGAYPYTPQAEGMACTIDGRSGRLRRRGNWLVCVADTEPDESDYDGNARVCPECDDGGLDDDGYECKTCGGTGSVPHNYERSAEEAFDTQTHTEGLGARRADAASVRQQIKDHEQRRQQIMDSIYADYDRTTAAAWREGK